MKKYLTRADTAFAAFDAVKAPGGTARIVHGAADGLASCGDPLSRFVDAL